MIVWFYTEYIARKFNSRLWIGQQNQKNEFEDIVEGHPAGLSCIIATSVANNLSHHEINTSAYSSNKLMHAKIIQNLSMSVPGRLSRKILKL